jgi:Transposase, Mutator family
VGGSRPRRLRHQRDPATMLSHWLLEPRRRAERAFVQVVCEYYVRGVSTRVLSGSSLSSGSSGSRSLGSRRWPRSSTKPPQPPCEGPQVDRSRPDDRVPQPYRPTDASREAELVQPQLGGIRGSPKCWSTPASKRVISATCRPATVITSKLVAGNTSAGTSGV